MNTIGRLDLPKMKRRRSRSQKLWLAQLWTFVTLFWIMARAPALFFRLELADAIVYKITTTFVDLILLFYLSMLARELIDI